MAKKNNILRIWKIGNSKEKILPSKKTIKYLKKLIKVLDLGGRNLIWDDMISVEQFELNKPYRKNKK